MERRSRNQISGIDSSARRAQARPAGAKRGGRRQAIRNSVSYVVEFVFGNRSRLIWINRSGHGEGSLGRLVAVQRALHSIAR